MRRFCEHQIRFLVTHYTNSTFCRHFLHFFESRNLLQFFFEIHKDFLVVFLLDLIS